MPNYCYNYIRIEGDVATIARLKAEFGSEMVEYEGMTPTFSLDLRKVANATHAPWCTTGNDTTCSLVSRIRRCFQGTAGNDEVRNFMLNEMETRQYAFTDHSTEDSDGQWTTSFDTAYSPPVTGLWMLAIAYDVRIHIEFQYECESKCHRMTLVKRGCSTKYYRDWHPFIVALKSGCLPVLRWLEEQGAMGVFVKHAGLLTDAAAIDGTGQSTAFLQQRGVEAEAEALRAVAFIGTEPSSSKERVRL